MANIYIGDLLDVFHSSQSALEEVDVDYFTGPPSNPLFNGLSNGLFSDLSTGLSLCLHLTSKVLTSGSDLTIQHYQQIEHIVRSTPCGILSNIDIVYIVQISFPCLHITLHPQVFQFLTRSITLSFTHR